MIIGFGHRKRVGKDTSASLLCGMLPTDLAAIRRGFASELKWTCFNLFRWAGHEEPSYYDSFPEARDMPLMAVGMTPREIWIEIGNQMRNIHPEVWIRCLLEGNEQCDALCVPDVRYPNEVKAIRDMGGILVKIENPRVPVTHDVADDAICDDFNGWDFVIVNDGTVDELQEKLRPVAAAVMERLKCGTGST